VTATAGEPFVEVAVDNDVLLKAVCYGLSARFWPRASEPHVVGVLGAARFVVDDRINRAELTRDKAAARTELEALLRAATVLEPTEGELSLAAEMEVVAQREALSLDAGETQLAAMLIDRAIATLETGDKRAIRSIEALLDHLEAVSGLAGRLRCLEQIVRRLVAGDDSIGEVADAVCRESNVDRALSICFACTSKTFPGREAVLEGLDSYIADLRRQAPRALEPQ
jgi:hypothetical protein